MYRGVKFYEAAVRTTNGDLAREAGVGGAGQGGGGLAQGPGGGEGVPARYTAK
jgi:hypothetical protein